MGSLRGRCERRLDPLSLQPFRMPYCCSGETGKGPGKTPELRRVQGQPGLRPSAQVPDVPSGPVHGPPRGTGARTPPEGWPCLGAGQGGRFS